MCNTYRDVLKHIVAAIESISQAETILKGMEEYGGSTLVNWCAHRRIGLQDIRGTSLEDIKEAIERRIIDVYTGTQATQEP